MHLNSWFEENDTETIIKQRLDELFKFKYYKLNNPNINIGGVLNKKKKKYPPAKPPAKKSPPTNKPPKKSPPKKSPPTNKPPNKSMLELLKNLSTNVLNADEMADSKELVKILMKNAAESTVAKINNKVAEITNKVADSTDLTDSTVAEITNNIADSTDLTDSTVAEMTNNTIINLSNISTEKLLEELNRRILESKKN